MTTNGVYSSNPTLYNKFIKKTSYSTWVESKAENCVDDEVMYAFHNNHVNGEFFPMPSIVLAKFVMVLFRDANAHKKQQSYSNIGMLIYLSSQCPCPTTSILSSYHGANTIVVTIADRKGSFSPSNRRETVGVGVTTMKLHIVRQYMCL